MAIKRIVPIDYLNRDFESIKGSLVDYAKRYFPDTFQDFNEASFGALMLDAVAYVGDILSFYLDYQVNESFIDSAIEYTNVARIARQMGYRQKGNPVSSGPAAFFVKIPRAATSDGPDNKLIPVLKAGSSFGTGAGRNFTLTQDVDFNDPSNEIVVATVSENAVQSYAIKAYGTVISGQTESETFTIGEYKPNLLLTLSAADVSEIISIEDDQGHIFYEVENLSQDTIFTKIENRRDTDVDAPSYVLKPISVPRRYTVEQFQGITYIQFGAGSDSSLKNIPVARVSDIALKVTGKNYITTSNFDPSRLNENDKLGISPSNTSLFITFRKNSRDDTNAPARSLTVVRRSILDFVNANTSTSTVEQASVYSSISVLNEIPITGDTGELTIEELKSRAIGAYASQGRAVTKLDYESLAYRMPPGFGSIAKCNVAQDPDSNRRNLNMYVVSKTKSDGNYLLANEVTKSNLKTWLERHKMMNDTIDIKDARIINFGIEYKAVGISGVSQFSLISAIQQAMIEYLSISDFTIGEPFNWTTLYQVINEVPGVLDADSVKLVQKTSADYSSSTFNFDRAMSRDGRTLFIPEDSVLELKYPDVDIIGTIA